MPTPPLLAVTVLLLGCTSTAPPPASPPSPTPTAPAVETVATPSVPAPALPGSSTTTPLPAGPHVRVDAAGLHLGETLLVALVDGAFPAEAVRGRRFQALQQSLMATQPGHLVLELGATEPFALLRSLLFTAGISGVNDVVLAVRGPGGQPTGIPLSLPRITRDPAGGLKAPAPPAARLRLGPDRLERREGTALIALAGTEALGPALAPLAAPAAELHIDVSGDTAVQRLVDTWDAARGDPAAPRFGRLVVDGDGL